MLQWAIELVDVFIKYNGHLALCEIKESDFLNEMEWACIAENQCKSTSKVGKVLMLKPTKNP